MQLTSLCAALVALTGAGSLALGQNTQRDRVQPLPPEAARQMHRESLLRAVENLPWAATEVDANGRTLSAHPLSRNEGVPVEDPEEKLLAKYRNRPNPHPVGSVQWILAGGFPMTLDRFPVAADAKVLIDGAAHELKDLKPGMRLTLVLSKDKSSVARIEAVTDDRAVLKSIDADKKTVTVALQGKEHVLALADGVLVYAEGEGDLVYGKMLALADLKAGARLALHMRPSKTGPEVSIIRVSR